MSRRRALLPVALAGTALAGAWGLRSVARAEVRALEERLRRAQAAPPRPVEELSALPAPARRWLERAVAEGTPHAAWARLSLRGRVRRTTEDPWRAFEAWQTITPDAFVWQGRLRWGPLRWSGHDTLVAGAWERRRWLFDLIPVSRETGSAAARAAAGRHVLELLWIPTALWPSDRVRWSARDERTAVAEVSSAGHTVTLTVEVDDDGRLLAARVGRWRGEGYTAAPATWGTVRITEHAHHAGRCIPSRLVVGWDVDGRRPFLTGDLSVTAAAYG